MKSDVKINKELVKWAREIIKFKKEYWEKAFPNIKFDEDGRVKVGFLPSYDKDEFYRKIKQNTSPLFEECLDEAYKELRLKPIPLQNIEYIQYLNKRIVVETETGFTQERALPGILGRANSIWERKMPMYRPLRNIYKPMAKARENQRGINSIKNVLSKMEEGNTYIAYDNLMRVFQAKDIFLSINPLDKLFSSGGGETNSITKFSSCWSNNMKTVNGDIKFSPYGGYANPLAQIKLGEHVLCGMIIIPNDNVVEVNGMTFYGMLQRSHVWLNEDAIHIENIYPDKENTSRRETICNILDQTIKTMIPSGDIVLKVPEYFDKEAWGDEYATACSYGKSPYLDRCCVHSDGDVEIYY